MSTHLEVNEISLSTPANSPDLDWSPIIFARIKLLAKDSFKVLTQHNAPEVALMELVRIMDICDSTVVKLRKETR